MKKILVAIDGSDAALKGARAAFDLARPFESEVTLLVVVPPIVLPGDAPWAPMDEIHQGELKRGEKLLAEALSALGQTALTVSTRVVLGPVAETISDEAEQGAFDLVVLGSHGKGAVRRALLGSVADRVMHLCTRPVLIVP